MTTPLRLSEDDVRTLLLVQAVEDTDREGVLLTPPARAAATRRAFDDGAPSGDDVARLRRRASLLRDDVLREAPVLGRVLDPPRLRGPVVLATLAVAVVAGALTNVLGTERHVSVLAFPLAGILLWNLAVYAGLAVRLLLRVVARLRGGIAVPGRLARAGQWIEGAWLAALARRLGVCPGIEGRHGCAGASRAARGAWGARSRPPIPLGGTARSVAVTDAIRRFQRLWLPTAAPLIAARVRVVLHLAALAMAAGAIAGMYVSGIAFEYRATWESTWLEPPAVQRYLDVVLGPAARVLGTRVPDVASLRGPAGEGSAAPWIHLWGTTLALFVLAPRATLALLDTLRAARLARRLPLHVDAGYVTRALQSGRGAATVVEIVYYSCAPDTAVRERLHTALQDEFGARAVIHDNAHLAYGDDPDRIVLPENGSRSGVVVLVFTLAQTPEPEVHGDFATHLHAHLARSGWQLRVALESTTYRQRTGSATRVAERRATWDRLLRDLQLQTIELST
jgi:hypothetical protein